MCSRVPQVASSRRPHPACPVRVQSKLWSQPIWRCRWDGRRESPRWSLRRSLAEPELNLFPSQQECRPQTLRRACRKRRQTPDRVTCERKPGTGRGSANCGLQIAGRILWPGAARLPSKQNGLERVDRMRGCYVDGPGVDSDGHSAVDAHGAMG
jgi:hypothetical protein